MYSSSPPLLRNNALKLSMHARTIYSLGGYLIDFNFTVCRQLAWDDGMMDGSNIDKAMIDESTIGDSMIDESMIDKSMTGLIA